MKQAMELKGWCEPMTVLEQLRDEKERQYKGGLYHLTQILFSYNSNHIEGSRLTEEQTRYIFETKSFFPSGEEPIRADDVIETVNHFRLFDLMLESVEMPLTEGMIKEYHRILKSGTTDSGLSWFRVGDYKAVANVVGNKETATPEQVPGRMAALLREYHHKELHTLEDLADFHYRFERIHPFQDGNGRVGRMILFKECLKNGLTPFVVLEQDRQFYYRGLSEYEREPGYLLGTFGQEQDIYEAQIKRLSPVQESGEPEL